MIRLPKDCDRESFLDDYMDEILWKPYIIQVASLGSIGFAPVAITPERINTVIFASHTEKVSEKILLIKGSWAIKFGNTYVVEDIVPITLPNGKVEGFGVRINGILYLYDTDMHMSVNLRVYQILNLLREHNGFDTRQDLFDSARFLYGKTPLNSLST